MFLPRICFHVYLAKKLEIKASRVNNDMTIEKKLQPVSELCSNQQALKHSQTSFRKLVRVNASTKGTLKVRVIFRHKVVHHL